MHVNKYGLYYIFGKSFVLFILIKNVCACICVSLFDLYAPYECRSPRRLKGDTGSSRTGVIDYMLPCDCWKLNLNPLGEQ